MSKKLLMVMAALLGVAYLALGWVAVLGLLALAAALRWYLRGIVKIKHPTVRVSYELRERSHPTLAEILKERFS